MHGEKIHEDRGIDRRYPSQKGRGGDKSCDWRELWSEPEAGKGAHQPSKSKGTNGGSGICPASEGMAAEGSGQQVRKNVDRPMAFAAFVAVDPIPVTSSLYINTLIC